jgi:predicted component of type VI protein secretion system
MWSLTLIKGAELGDKPVPSVRLPEPFVPPQRFFIGRDPASQWLLTDRLLAVSGRHCEIVASAEGPVLHDRSTNGTFVNGAAERLPASLPLRDGDRLEIGPFTVLVSGPPMPPRGMAAAPPPRAAAPLRRPSVSDTQPFQGGDPAAMLARGGGFEPVGLTEILRAAPQQEASDVDVTKIRVAAPAPPRTVPAASPQPAASPAVPPAVAPPAHLAEALSRGLGVPPAALPPMDLLLLAERVAAAARQASQQRGEDPAALLRRLAAPGGG